MVISNDFFKNISEERTLEYSSVQNVILEKLEFCHYLIGFFCVSFHAINLTKNAPDK